MSEYDRNKIRRLDLTVLLIFLGLLRTRKASAVALELGLTNSTISHAIRRLRDVFGDELFIRKPHGLDPTAFALEIERDVRTAVDAVQSALVGPSPFHPATAKGLIRIAAQDHEIATLLPKMLARVTREAPGVRFSMRTLQRAEVLRGLNEGTLDFAIGFFQNLGDDYDITPLRTETYSVVARADHPIFERDLTLDIYTSQTHALVSRDGSLSGIVDTALAREGRSRRVVVAIPSFISALSILADTDLIATVPTSLATRFAARFNLGVAPPPLKIRSFDVTISRHRRNVRDPMLSWCLGHFANHWSDPGQE